MTETREEYCTDGGFTTTILAEATYWDDLVEHLERKVHARDRYIALLRERLGRAGETVKRTHITRSLVNYHRTLLDAEQEKSARLEAVVRQVEWCRTGPEPRLAATCPACYGDKRQGHRLDCPIGLALREAE